MQDSKIDFFSEEIKDTDEVKNHEDKVEDNIQNQLDGYDGILSNKEFKDFPEKGVVTAEELGFKKPEIISDTKDSYEILSKDDDLKMITIKVTVEKNGQSVSKVIKINSNDPDETDVSNRLKVYKNHRLNYNFGWYPSKPLGPITAASLGIVIPPNKEGTEDSYELIKVDEETKTITVKVTVKKGNITSIKNIVLTAFDAPKDISDIPGCKDETEKLDQCELERAKCKSKNQKKLAKLIDYHEKMLDKEEKNLDSIKERIECVEKNGTATEIVSLVKEEKTKSEENIDSIKEKIKELKVELEDEDKLAMVGIGELFKEILNLKSQIEKLNQVKEEKPADCKIECEAIEKIIKSKKVLLEFDIENINKEISTIENEIAEIDSNIKGLEFICTKPEIENKKNKNECDKIAKKSEDEEKNEDKNAEINCVDKACEEIKELKMKKSLLEENIEVQNKKKERLDLELSILV